MRVLLVEDDHDIAGAIRGYLRTRGHEVAVAHDGEDGWRQALRGGFDALVLDRALPGLDGIALCQRLRNEAGNATPVLMVTALTTMNDKLAGFAAGADDYLVKPFDLPELEARLQALHRRAAGQAPPRRLQVADLVYDVDAHVATRGGRLLSLSPTGRRMLECLMRNTQRVVPRSELEQVVWGDETPAADVLPVHIHALRQAVETGHARKLLHTVRGVGYRLAALDEP